MVIQILIPVQQLTTVYVNYRAIKEASATAYIYLLLPGPHLHSNTISINITSQAPKVNK